MLQPVVPTFMCLQAASAGRSAEPQNLHVMPAGMGLCQ